jgi:hypothetical protein
MLLLFLISSVILLNEPYEPQERIANEQQPKGQPAVGTQLYGKLFPEYNHYSQCKIQQEED